MPTLSMLVQLYFPLKDNTACRAFSQGLGLHAQLRWPLICNSFKTKEISLEIKLCFQQALAMESWTHMEIIFFSFNTYVEYVFDHL